MSAFVEIARTGCASIGRHPIRSAVTIAAVLSVLVPYLVGMGLVEGIRQEALVAIGSADGPGAIALPDLYVAGSRFGRRVPIRLAAAEDIRRFEGVVRVIPRIVGRVTLGKKDVEAVLVGLPQEELAEAITGATIGKVIEGQLPRTEPGGAPQLVLGSALAKELGQQIGGVIPPILRSSRGEKTPRIVGIFRTDSSMWQSRVVLTTFETAAELFDQQGLATDLLVHCRAGQPAEVSARIVREVRGVGDETGIGCEVILRSDLESLLPVGLGHRAGVFNLVFVVAFAVAILAILVISGFGLAERRRTIGILKATGWQTDQVLLRGLVEHLLLGLIGATASILLAFVWLKWFNGFWIAGVFVSGLEISPGIPVPFVLAPVPVLLAVLIACLLVTVGSVFSTWRTAVTSPAEAMR